jgi:hypothetical protein
MSNRDRITGYPGEVPRFPICGSGREGCALLGFHGHQSHQTDEERERIRAWRAWFDAQLEARR